MASKIILDANIILDLSLNRSNDTGYLTKIYEAVVAGKFKCFITTSLLHICAYWLKQSLGFSDSKKVILSLLNDVRVIDAPHSKVVEAVLSDMPDVEDAMQYYTALHHNIDCFISKDKQFAKAAREHLPVHSPQDFIKRFMN